MIHCGLVVFREVFTSHVWILLKTTHSLSTTTEAVLVVWGVVRHRGATWCPCCCFDIHPRCFSEYRAESERLRAWAKGVLVQASLELPQSSIVGTELRSWDWCENCLVDLTGHPCGWGWYGPQPMNSEVSLSHALVILPFPYRNGSVHNHFMIKDVY